MVTAGELRGLRVGPARGRREGASSSSSSRVRKIVRDISNKRKKISKTRDLRDSYRNTLVLKTRLALPGVWRWGTAAGFHGDRPAARRDTDLTVLLSHQCQTLTAELCRPGLDTRLIPECHLLKAQARGNLKKGTRNRAPTQWCSFVFPHTHLCIFVYVPECPHEHRVGRKSTLSNATRFQWLVPFCNIPCRDNLLCRY